MTSHKDSAPDSVTLGIITLSSTRTIEDDESGNWIKAQAELKGHHTAFHLVIPDDMGRIAQTVRDAIRDHTPQVIITNGGTGITQKDMTIEAIRPMFAKELTAFATVFALLSYQEIGSSAILSRATAGVIDKTVVFCLPGSIKACRLACNDIIFNELGHVVKHVDEL